MGRRVLDGFHQPSYRRRGLAGLGDPVVELNNSQIQEFLGRHPGTRSAVSMFENQVAAGGYTGQQVLDSAGNSGYAIPPYGIAVADSAFGNVLIFPDAEGVLRYTGNVSPGVTHQTNLPMPPPVPFPNSNPLAGWESVLAALPWVIGGVLALSLFNALPRRRG